MVNIIPSVNILAATNSIFTAEKNLAWQQQIILEAIIRLDSGVAVFRPTRLYNIPMRNLFLEKGSNYNFY